MNDELSSKHVDTWRAELTGMGFDEADIEYMVAARRLVRAGKATSVNDITHHLGHRINHEILRDTFFPN